MYANPEAPGSSVNPFTLEMVRAFVSNAEHLVIGTVDPFFQSLSVYRWLDSMKMAKPY